jgi:oligosaccharide repeat unit polymerase
MVLVSLLVITVFGWTGDIRGRSTPFSHLVTTQRQSEVFEFLPSGFLWFYVYVTSPLANVINNIDNIQPSYIPHYSIMSLVPSFGRDIIATGANDDPMERVNQNLTVSTFYSGFIADFGLFGALIAVCVIQFFCVIIYFPAYDERPWAVLAYAVVFECIVFSVFYNLFFLHTYIVQVLFACYLGVKEKRLKERREGSRRLVMVRHPGVGQPIKASPSGR